jgi:hypothetical protein
VNVALVQTSTPFDEGDEARRARIADMVKRTAGRDAVVSPEPWDVGYYRFNAYAECAGYAGESAAGSQFTGELVTPDGSALILDSVTAMGCAAS